MTLKARLLAIQEVALCLVRKWWRPGCQVGLVATVWTQGAILPLINRQAPDLTGLAALVTSVVAAFAVREWGKARGTAE